MTGKKKTVIILITVVVALIAWDIFVWMTPEKDDMISHVILYFFRNHPVVSILLGMLLGHLLWPQVIEYCSKCGKTTIVQGGKDNAKENKEE